MTAENVQLVQQKCRMSNLCSKNERDYRPVWLRFFWLDKTCNCGSLLGFSQFMFRLQNEGDREKEVGSAKSADGYGLIKFSLNGFPAKRAKNTENSDIGRSRGLEFT